MSLSLGLSGPYHTAGLSGQASGLKRTDSMILFFISYQNQIKIYFYLNRFSFNDLCITRRGISFSQNKKVLLLNCRSDDKLFSHLILTGSNRVSDRQNRNHKPEIHLTRLGQYRDPITIAIYGTGVPEMPNQKCNR